MSLIGKLKDKTTRTLVSTDLVPVQDKDGNSWYKTTLQAIKDFVYQLIFSDNNTFTGDNAFTKPLKIANGVASNEAVNILQLNKKATIATGSLGKYILKGEPDYAGLLSDSDTLNALNIPILAAAPTSSTDTIGADGDLGIYVGDLYFKNVGKWYKFTGSTF